MADELNLEAERAAFEAHATPRGLTLMRAKIGNGYYLSDTNEAWHAWLAARRTAPPADVGADGLPLLPKPLRFAQWTGGEVFAYTAEQYRQGQREAIAADRRKQAALQALYDAGQDIEASGERQSIDDDPKFQQLAEHWRGEPYGTRSFENAWAELIAYIDGRPAGTAVHEGWKLVPNNPTPTMCRAGFLVSEAEHDPAGVYRAMVAAAPSHQSPGKEG